MNRDELVERVASVLANEMAIIDIGDLSNVVVDGHFDMRAIAGKVLDAMEREGTGE